jgi:hypothetical protein
MKGYFINFNQRTMLIVTSFICAFFTFAVANLYAQELPIELQQKPSDMATGLTLTQEQLDDVKKYIPSKPECFNPEIENEAMVRYQTSALIYLKWNKLDGEPNVYLQDVQKRTFQPLKTEFGDLIFSKLALDQSYQLIGKNSCGSDAILKTISTARPIVNEVALSDDFYKAMTSWTINAKGVPLSRFLKGLPTVNYYERLAFFQQHLLKNELLEASLSEGEFPEVKSESNAAATTTLACDCTFLLNRRRIAAPGRAWNNNFAAPADNFFAHYSQTGWYAVDDLTNRAFSMTGPAKWQEQTSGGHCDSGSSEWEIDDSQSNNGSPNFASIGYNLMCTNHQELPSECVCDKNVIVRADYTTQLNTSAATQRAFGWCWFNRGATASVEDWAVVIEHKIKSAEVTVLGGGRANARSNCSSTVNTDFFINYFKLAIVVAAKALEIQASSNGGNTQINNLYPTSFLNDLSAKISALITTPFRNVEPCGNDQKDARLINYEGFRKLTPNNPVEYTMYSYSHLRNSGYTRWSSSSRVISKFMLASILNPAGSNPNCCSAPLGNWISSTISTDFSSIRPVIQDFFQFHWPATTGRPTISTDFGNANGPTPPNCITPGDFRGGNTSSNLTVRSQTDGVYLQQKGISQPYECIVSDVMGHVIYRHNGAVGEDKVWDYSNINASNAPSTGIYLVQVKMVDGESQTFKIFKK